MSTFQHTKDMINAGGKDVDEKGVKFILGLLLEGKDPDFIIAKLVENGYDYQKSAEMTNHLYIRNVEAAEKQESKGANANLIIGAIILIIGLGVTFGSNSHVIAYGAILVGAIKVVQGLAGRVG